MPLNYAPAAPAPHEPRLLVTPRMQGAVERRRNFELSTVRNKQ